MFNWARFLTEHHIEYVMRGPNVARNHLNIKCPWCGESDPSQHLGISLVDGSWGCWRSRDHRGRSRAKLIQGLLRCTLDEAHRLAGTEPSSLPDDNALVMQVASALGESIMIEDNSILRFPQEFKPMSCGATSSRPFIEYLKRRHYEGMLGSWIIDKYQLRYALRGEYAYRLIIPLYDQEERLVSWTGRSILKHEALRYKTLSTKEKNGVRALAPSSDVLLGHRLLVQCFNPEMLIVCEGPFDAMRISALGHQRGIWGTCLFGLNISKSQTSLLQSLAQRFRHVALLLDADAEMARFRIAEQVGFSTDRLTLPAGIKDAAELTTKLAAGLLPEWLAKVRRNDHVNPRGCVA